MNAATTTRVREAIREDTGRSLFEVGKGAVPDSLRKENHWHTMEENEEDERSTTQNGVYTNYTSTEAPPSVAAFVSVSGA